MNSALLLAVATLNSSIDSTDGNSSREGPPKRTRCVEMPSTENDVMNGSAPATEMSPPRSCWTPCDSVATTIGLVLLVARKFSASLAMSAPESRAVDRRALGFDHRRHGRDTSRLLRAGELHLHVRSDDLPRQQRRLRASLGETRRAGSARRTSPASRFGNLVVARRIGAAFGRHRWSTLVTVTVTPGRTPPDGSVTVPVTVPNVDCAAAGRLDAGRGSDDTAAAIDGRRDGAVAASVPLARPER